MPLEPADMLLIFALTTVSAVPAVIISVYFTIKHLAKKQIEQLPALLELPSVQAAVRSSMVKIAQQSSGEFSKAMSEQMVPILKVALAAELHSQAETMKKAVTGVVGNFVRNLKKDLVGGERKPGEKAPGALGAIGDLGTAVDQLSSLLIKNKGGKQPNQALYPPQFYG